MIRNGVSSSSQLEDSALNERNATSISTPKIPVTILIRALGEVQSAAVQIHPSHFETTERGNLQLSIQLRYEGISVLHTLNKEERNYLVRNSPTLFAACLANAQRQMADQRGSRLLEDCSISWRPSFIPFHLAYTIVRSRVKCQHLASVRNLKTRTPKQYGDDLIPLARIFLDRPSGSRSCHLPFIWDPAHSSSSEVLDLGERRARETIKHGQLIVTQFNTVQDMDITTAEATAKLVNEDKIIPGLLALIFDPGPKQLGPPCLEKVGSDKNRPVAVHAGKHELDEDQSETIKPGKSDSQETDHTGNGSKKADPDKAKPSKRIAKWRTSVGNLKANNSKGSVEPSRAVQKEVATRKLREIERRSIQKQDGESRPTVRTKVIDPSPAVSKKRSRRSRPKSKTARALREPIRMKDDGSENVDKGALIPSGRSAQEPHSTMGEDSVAPKPSETSAPPSAPDCSSGCCTSELSLPRPSYFPPRVASPSKRALEEELSDIVSDDIHRYNGTHHYSRDSTGYAPRTAQPNSTSEGGVDGLAWAYATHTDADEALLEAGVWLWEKPRTYFYPHSISIKMSDPYVLAPVIVSHESTGTSFPFLEYSGETVHIIPHDEPWEDVRSVECHPDFLPPCKLVEYQACEAAGYYVWRHDRDQLPCRKPGCEALVMDHNLSSVFCQGCGPKTVIRYCSFEHQIEHIEEHWIECGDPGLVMQCVIDHATTPAYFSDKPPEIAERRGVCGLKCAELQRQKIYFMNNGGYYTLFDPVTHDIKTLSWPKSDPRWQELDARIERLLNIAFFGTHKHGIITYICRLLRELLCCTAEWTDQIQDILDAQIRNEFKYSGDLGSDLIHVGEDSQCDCKWPSRDFLPHGHLSTCTQEKMPTMGSNSETTGLKAWVERMEKEHWILRAWHQQHPTEKNWRVRANGFGMIPLQPGESIYRLGPGWIGWEGRKGNGRGRAWVLNKELRNRFSVS